VAFDSQAQVQNAFSLGQGGFNSRPTDGNVISIWIPPRVINRHGEWHPHKEENGVNIMRC
jgi:hypothetical protein